MSFFCEGPDDVFVDALEVDFPCVQELGKLQVNLRDSSDSWATGYPDDESNVVGGKNGKCEIACRFKLCFVPQKCCV